MKIFTQIARVLVGLLFIFSGFIKANDPYGFSYKLDEYFQVFGDKIWSPLGWFEHISLGLAIFIVALEMLQGFLLLTGSRIKINSWLLLLLIVFFTFLTFYSAYTGYIKECGCFGDVIPLKAWQSFYKDLILLVLIVVIMFGRKHIKPIIKKQTIDNGVVAFFTVVSIFIPVYTYAYLPFFETSDFAVGKNIMAERKAYMDEQQAKIGKLKFAYKEKATGKRVEYTTDELTKAMTADTSFSNKFDYIERIEPKADTTEKRLLPLSVGIDFMDVDNNNMTDAILGNPKYQFVLIMTHLEDASTSAMNDINDLAQLADKDSVSFVGLTNTAFSKIDSFRHEHQNAFDFYHCSDDTPLKGAIRSNPGLMLLKGGVVIEKWSWRAIPSYSHVKEKYMSK